ncbi:MAG: hypothetical protein IJX33_02245 [Akkermansia sp.]|nr:hypothetical protein [Akkermansia sp.]MBQ8375858.1 hypothetical protein [Akkermansia sp.]
MKQIIINAVKCGAQLGLALVCMTCLTSCSAVTGLVGFLIALPFRLLDAIIP